MSTLDSRSVADRLDAAQSPSPPNPPRLDNHGVASSTTTGRKRKKQPKHTTTTRPRGRSHKKCHDDRASQLATSKALSSKDPQVYGTMEQQKRPAPDRRKIDLLEFEEQGLDQRTSTTEDTGLDCLKATKDNVTAINGMIGDIVAQTAIGNSENKSSRLQSSNPASGIRQAHTDYTIADMEQLRQDAIMAAKEVFVRNQQHALSRIPQSIKDMYGQIGFVKWDKDKFMRPVLVLNPYHVPPAPVRSSYFVCMHRFVIVVEDIVCLTLLVYLYYLL
jgi:hypothetical protein